MYLNHIEIQQNELVEIETNESLAKDRFQDDGIYEGCLNPVGGGKDSIVSLEILKGMNNTTYHINESHSILDVIKVTEKEYEDCYVKRFLDRTIIDLNGKGFLNGHTPFSAIVAFSSFIAAHLYRRKYIVLSNESSANESTVKDSFVNHQYSKSFEFEEDFNWYIGTVTDSDIHYFSMLRALNEIQIAKIFGRAKKYHSVFKSCNVGSKENKWCCNCAKCLFVYIILSSTLSDEELLAIFKENLLDKESLEEIFCELMGYSENKPFECVGTRGEVLSALKAYIEAGRKSYMTEKYQDYILNNAQDVSEYLKEWNNENNIPDIFIGNIKEALDA